MKLKALNITQHWKYCGANIKENAEREFALYFTSTAKTIIGSENSLDRYFQEVFKMINNWISEGSG